MYTALTHGGRWMLDEQRLAIESNRKNRWFSRSSHTMRLTSCLTMCYINAHKLSECTTNHTAGRGRGTRSLGHDWRDRPFASSSLCTALLPCALVSTTVLDPPPLNSKPTALVLRLRPPLAFEPPCFVRSSVQRRHLAHGAAHRSERTIASGATQYRAQLSEHSSGRGTIREPEEIRSAERVDSTLECDSNRRSTTRLRSARNSNSTDKH